MTEQQPSSVPDAPEPADETAVDETVAAAATAALAAADPAKGVVTDEHRIGALVAAGIAAQDPAVPDELAARRARRMPVWAQVAAAAAAVAVVAGGGYALGASRTPAEATTALPAISLSDGARDTMSGGAAPAAAEGAADSAMGVKAFWPGYGWHTVYADGGLPTAGGTGNAWAFDPSGVASAETAARIAATLGVAGDVAVQWGSWVVGPNDGTGPTVTVSGDGQASFYLYDPTLDPWSCQTDPELNPSAGIVTPRASVCDGSVATPTGDAAVARARDALTSVGVDLTGTQVTTSDDATTDGAAHYGSVTFSQVIEGQLTGVTWSVTLVADGVQSMYGPLAPVVELGTYDVISPAQAVERLNDPRFGASGGVMPLAVEDSARDTVAGDAVSSDVVEPSETDEPTVPAVPGAGSPISWPVTTVTLVSARLGVTLVTDASGATLLVPAYELTDSDGATWSVLAVVDDQLDFTAAG